MKIILSKIFKSLEIGSYFYSTGRKVWNFRKYIKLKKLLTKSEKPNLVFGSLNLNLDLSSLFIHQLAKAIAYRRYFSFGETYCNYLNN